MPEGCISEEWQSRVEALYREAGALIEGGRLKEALELIFSTVRLANKYFDEQKPWIQVKEDHEACGTTLFICVQIIANLANLHRLFLSLVIA